ncbi:cation:proton antiporter domain-containing protein [Parasphingorhabdus pacifica]
MTAFNTALAVIGAAVLLIGLLSDPIKRAFLSGPLLALLLGVVLGPRLLGVLVPAEWGDQSVLLEQAARITVAMALMGIALRLPRDYLVRHARSLAIVLGPVMILMWLVSALIVFALLGTPLWVALLVGAVVTPTDPVVASSIVQGRMAQRYLPARLRHFLSAESGANDVLAFPLVLLAVLMLTHPPAEALPDWGLRVVLWECGGAVVLGALLGYVAGKILAIGYRHRTVAPTSHLVYSLALTLTVLGGTELLGTNGLLAVFIAGLLFRQAIPEEEDRSEERVQEAVNDFFLLPVFVLLGLMLPWDEWAELGWRGVALVAAVLLLRRLPAFLALAPFMRSVRGVREAAFLGWFGPVGAAALFYANTALQETGQGIVWAVGSLIVCASVLVHGVTATPATRLLGRREDRGNEADSGDRPATTGG